MVQRLPQPGQPYYCQRDFTPYMLSLHERCYYNCHGERHEIVQLLDDDGEQIDLDDLDHYDFVRWAIAEHPLSKERDLILDLDVYANQVYDAPGCYLIFGDGLDPLN